MKEITAILLILIAVIGIISIIIVKLYYRDKEKDDEKERLEEFLNSTKTDYEDEKPKRVRRTARKHENISEAQRYANTINSQSKIDLQETRRVSDVLASDNLFENETVGGTTALLRQRSKAMENAPKKQARRVGKPQTKPIPKKQAATQRISRTPDSVKAQMDKEEEVKVFQEPIKPEHTAAIKSAREKDIQPKPRQVPMTEKQKEFIEKEANKLIVDDTDSAVKVVKSIKPADTIDEIKESAKIEESDEIVEKAEKDTAEFIKKIEEVKEDAEEKIAETAEETKEEITEAKDKVKEEIAETKEEAKEEVSEIKEKIAENVAETKEIKEKIAETVAKTKEEAKEELAETKDDAKEIKEKITETVAEIKEEAKEIVEKVEEPTAKPEISVEETIEEETKMDEVKSTIAEGASKVSDKISQAAERVYNDDLHLILNKGEKEEVDETPENEFVTINSDTETTSPSNELISNAIQSIRNFRKPNVPEKPVVEEIRDDIVPDDYAQDLGDGIEYIGDTITITPIHEEEIDLANNQPNEDVDKIYEEINKRPYNKTDDAELSESFEDVTDETSEKDANVYTEEDYKKVEAQEKEKKLRAENTKKILGSKGISEDELKRRAEAKEKSKRTRKAAPAEEPVEDGQKRLMVHKARTDVEEVYINGTLFELKVGQVVIYEINGENYSSQILRLKPGYIGVRYRSKKIWVKSNTVKKILK